MLLDRTTEAIAHFLGLFDLAAEDVRLRKGYEEFAPPQSHPDHEPQLFAEKVHLAAPLAPSGFNPGVVYYPEAPNYVLMNAPSHVDWRPIPTPDTRLQQRDPDIDPRANRGAAVPGKDGEPNHIEPPGSSVTVIHQTTRLSDDDYASVGAHGLKMERIGDAEAPLARLLAEANRFDPLDGLASAEGANTTEELIAYVDRAAALFRDYAAVETLEPTDGVFVQHQGLDNTIRVNGVQVAEAPDLEDYHHKLPETEEPAKEGVESVRLKPTDPSYAQSAHGETFEAPGLYDDPAFVTIEAGSNTLVNTAVIANNSVAGHVMATLGDYVELDAIVQTNVYADMDSIGSVIADWTRSAGLTKSFNIAEFVHQDYSAEHHAKTTLGEFPKGWAVATIDGDLTITAWIEQLNFMMDNDVVIASSTGVKSTVTAGDNLQMNYFSLNEIGLYFDLIIVDGSIYDGNIIMQANILLDDDLISALPGFSAGGKGALSTGDNLLWNSASIRNIQGNGAVEAMPGAYRSSAESFGSSKSLAKGVLEDPAFAGLAGLRVLHVKGDFVNVQFIKQTNILGDRDQVAAAKNQALKNHDAAWTIKTGGNDVINLASISDVDLTGKAYYGGKAYSDALLVQADLISDKPSFGLGDPAKLIGEAVAFLSDDHSDAGIGKAFHKAEAFALPSLDHASLDPMHTMVG